VHENSQQIGIISRKYT